MSKKRTNKSDTKRTLLRDAAGKFIKAIKRPETIFEQYQQDAAMKGRSLPQPGLDTIPEEEVTPKDPKEEYLEMVERRDNLLSRLMNETPLDTDVKEYERICNDMQERFNAFSTKEKAEVVKAIGAKFAGANRSFS